MNSELKVKPIKRAIISVSDKTGINDFSKFLCDQGIEIISTGGTAKILRSSGLNTTEISSITGFPEILDGRVKTLHPLIYGGILGQSGNTQHVETMKDHNINAIDLVVVNLYPFEKTIASGKDFNDCIENIDIGGPAMIRAGAKNHVDVTVVVDPLDYNLIKTELESHEGGISTTLRQHLAKKAYAHTAEYDSIISNWFEQQYPSESPQKISITGTLKQTLRYGENPHLKAEFYSDGNKIPGVTTAEQIQGKDLSYNNINDTDAAFELVAEFNSPAVAVIKHANPCGVATGETLLDSYIKAVDCDSVSAYGGIIALNGKIDEDLAAEISNLFAEVVIAPSISDEARNILANKKNLRVLITGGLPSKEIHRRLVKSVSGGFLIQDSDSKTIDIEKLKVVTQRSPTEDELDDMLFAFRVCKHTKSNAIIFAKNSATVGIGAGQMSRVDSSRIASWKAGYGRNGETNKALGSVVASDAFFPFSDGLITAAEAGATAVIQPGGSLRDDEVIAAADEKNLAMVFTGMRNFRH